jgi:hypothetical protein
MGRFTPIAGAETALTREFGKHVFEIAELLRVSHILYNYRVWVVVCAVGYEPVSTPRMPDKWLFTGYFCECWLLSKNAPGFAALIQ